MFEENQGVGPHDCVGLIEIYNRRHNHHWPTRDGRALVRPFPCMPLVGLVHHQSCFTTKLHHGDKEMRKDDVDDCLCYFADISLLVLRCYLINYTNISYLLYVTPLVRRESRLFTAAYYVLANKGTYTATQRNLDIATKESSDAYQTPPACDHKEVQRSAGHIKVTSRCVHHHI